MGKEVGCDTLSSHPMGELNEVTEEFLLPMSLHQKHTLRLLKAGGLDAVEINSG
jgi:hypothetical protein